MTREFVPQARKFLAKRRLVLLASVAAVGAAVILTLMATLFASWAWGFTLNRVSLFALIFSIGILVDDAIVVVENIHRHQQLFPEKSLIDIIPGAVDEVGGPTILATLTVIAALLPMAFVSGLMGPYMSPIPINSSLGMAISLAIAFTVTPWLALKLMKPHGAGHGHEAAATPGGLGPKLQRFFTRILTPLLDSARKRWLLLAGILVALLLSVGLTMVQWVVLKMLPFDNKSEFQVVVDMPAGTPLENTAAALHELGAFLAQQPEVRDLQGYAGTASPITFNGLVRQYYLRAEAEQGDLQVNLVDKKHRSDKSHVIAQRLRPELEKTGARHQARVKVVEVPPGPPVMSPLVAEVYGPDEAGRQALARRIAAAFAATPDIVGIDTSLKEPRATVLIPGSRVRYLAEIAEQEKRLTNRARSNKLTLADIEEQTIALSNLGAYDIDSFLGIVPPPVSAILTAGKMVMTPVPWNGPIVVRKMVSLSLAVDHRIIDSAYAARFLQCLTRKLEAPEGLT